MPKPATKKQLLDWKHRLEELTAKMRDVQNVIDEVDEEAATIKSEMKEYGMLKDVK